ncbi:retrovirus-related pol polyprotein from transposon TNT 1-94 [Tanacetum coccineum]
MVLEKKVNTKPINYAELNRLSKNFSKRFVPQRELSDEQALHPITVLSASSPVKIKALKKSVEITDLNAQLQEKVFVITTLKNDLRKFKGKDIVDNFCPIVSNTSTLLTGCYKLTPIMFGLPKVKNNREAHEYYLKHTMEQVAILREATFLRVIYDTLLSSTGVNPSTGAGGSKTSGNTKNDRILRTPSSNEKNRVEVQYRKVKSSLNKRDSDSNKIVGYSILQLLHLLLLLSTAGCPNCSVAQGTNMYSLSIGDMMASSPICLLSKATKTKSWLWHRRLSHLNFGTLNHLATHGLVRGLPRLKFEKDHLCSACAMGKSKKQSHKPKSEDTNQEKLYLLHMDLCGPMRVASVNGKKYILVIVDDYSRFTWVKFLASKDEALDFIIKFLKMIQNRLNATVRNIRTDNGTEFVNQTLRDYYEQVGISHKTSVAQTPQQNGVVERRIFTLVERLGN